MKPDVIKQTKELMEARQLRKLGQDNKPTGIKIKQGTEIKELMTIEVVNLINKQQKEILELKQKLESTERISELN